MVVVVVGGGSVDLERRRSEVKDGKTQDVGACFFLVNTASRISLFRNSHAQQTVASAAAAALRRHFFNPEGAEHRRSREERLRED